ncbi:MAG: hypothetical protein MUC56_07620 [Thermoanaerobaculales bacterium]|nr:hypothetical protein [Thermoanaerobaculales bacterium]
MDELRLDRAQLEPTLDDEREHGVVAAEMPGSGQEVDGEADGSQEDRLEKDVVASRSGSVVWLEAAVHRRSIMPHRLAPAGGVRGTSREDPPQALTSDRWQPFGRRQ